MTDTIFAVASGRGPAGISVIRASGPASRMVFESLAGRLPEPRRAVLRQLKAPNGLVIDEALCLWLPGPNSFTGEDGVEFHCHGASSVIALMLQCLGTITNCRLAQPGEFSRRAFDNGRMDLAAIEGLADLIDSETEHQRQQAVRQMMGGLSREIDQWRDDLIGILALFEAELDFADEGDVDGQVLNRAEQELLAVSARMARVLALGDRGERLREGLTVVLAGPPNSGKSTLLNALARRDVAIVSPIAGTTRDIVEARLDLGGYAVTLLDTAGMRETVDPVEQEGVRRMLARAETADIVVWLNSAAEDQSEPPVSLTSPGVKVLRVVTQIDRVSTAPAAFAISAVTGAGIDPLVQRLTELAAEQSARGDEGVILTRARHRQAVGVATMAVDRALAILKSAGTELVAEEVRLAVRSIGEITGHVGVEDVLDQVFSQFCIGK